MHESLMIAPGRAALLLVDLQEEQRHDPDFAACDIARVVDNAAMLLAAARGRAVPVFHAAYRRDYGLCPRRPFEPAGPEGQARFSDKDSPLVAICAEVAPSSGETVIFKNDASAFEGGTLAARLTDLGIEWLVIAGVWTEQCVAATVRDAMALGFRVLLVKDACASGSRAMHETAVLNLANRLYGGGVADTQRADGLLRGSNERVWRNEGPVPFRFTYETASALYGSL